ncbi:Uncharacterised protein [Salmonella enterica subsp. enterica serovar Typhimurium str. DT104]|nr:Uncharacterised protein [Salmonella enterica subsp. enterica serovar Typhimurium str. DT104]
MSFSFLGCNDLIWGHTPFGIAITRVLCHANQWQ